MDFSTFSLDKIEDQRPLSLPICIDLDGTLIKTDVLYELANQFLFQDPFAIFKLVFWLTKGKAVLKDRLSQKVELDIRTLPYNQGLLKWLKYQQSVGATLVLVTASPHRIATKIAQQLHFDEVYGSNKNCNLRGQVKRDFLVGKYGLQGFNYIGDSFVDRPVFQSAAHSLIVSSNPNKFKMLENILFVFDPEKTSFFKGLFLALRPHQWVKNGLLFIPLFTAHAYGSVDAIFSTMIGCFSFSLVASSVYLLNDLLDLPNDRLHRTKKNRSLAAGNLSILFAWLLYPVLLLAGFGSGFWFLNIRFGSVLLLYYVITLFYSLQLKKVAIVDVFILAALYTIRIIAGAVAIEVPLSFWLLLFSVFFFVSLAFVKRFTEIDTLDESKVLRGRGYTKDDRELVSSFGISSGYLAVLVLALYTQDQAIFRLYQTPELVWLSCPLLFYWISRVWLLVHRAEMPDDPIVFAIKDKVSWGVACLFILIFLGARVNWFN